MPRPCPNMARKFGIFRFWQEMHFLPAIFEQTKKYFLIRMIDKLVLQFETCPEKLSKNIEKLGKISCLVTPKMQKARIEIIVI